MLNDDNLKIWKRENHYFAFSFDLKEVKLDYEIIEKSSHIMKLNKEQNNIDDKIDTLYQKIEEKFNKIRFMLNQK